jgi:hypothetical protein
MKIKEVSTSSRITFCFFMKKYIYIISISFICIITIFLTGLSYVINLLWIIKNFIIILHKFNWNLVNIDSNKKTKFYHYINKNGELYSKKGRSIDKPIKQTTKNYKCSIH